MEFFTRNQEAILIGVLVSIVIWVFQKIARSSFSFFRKAKEHIKSIDNILDAENGVLLEKARHRDLMVQFTMSAALGNFFYSVLMFFISLFCLIMTIGYYQDSHKIIEIILLSTSAISFIAGSLILFYSGTLILASMRITLAWIRKLEKENG